MLTHVGAGIGPVGRGEIDEMAAQDVQDASRHWRWVNATSTGQPYTLGLVSPVTFDLEVKALEFGTNLAAQ
jgi:hypothetical protein